MLYIIKSTVILGILLSVYHLFLEKEKMHKFNRWYLLFSLVLAFATPLITVGYVHLPAMTESENLIPMLLSEGTPVVSAKNQHGVNWTSILFYSYLLVATGFLIRFIVNLGILLLKAHRNEKSLGDGCNLVLISEKVLPHTFFKYVFINKSEYLSSTIEEQLFTHELTHAKQMHSLDVVFVELIQVLFWFNPLISLFKKAIQLNHEFLADEQVVETHGKVDEYQHLLVEKAGSNKIIYLASNMNFSLTKKRLQMMNKQPGKWRSKIYAVITLPLFLLVLLLFGHQEGIAQRPVETDKDLKAEYFKDATIIIEEDGKKKVYQHFHDLSDEDKARIPLPPPPPPLPNGDSANPISPLQAGSIVVYNAKKNRLRISGNENNDAPPPPPPPSPPSAPSSLDLAIEIAKEGGSFLINGKIVSSDEAIALLKRPKKVATVKVSKQNGKKVMKIRTN